MLYSKHFNESIKIPFRFVILLFTVFFSEILIGIDLSFLGVYPRSIQGIPGIIFAPILHGSYAHLLSNAIPLLLLGAVLFYFYNKIAVRVFFMCYIPTGILVWLFAQPNYHIGASGLIYGIAFFLMTFGVFRKDFTSLIISIMIVFFYGSMVYGIFPNQPGVSWESHFFGALMGLVSAAYFAKYKKVSSFK
jgi:membrane associated rhomboid family serine protease